MLYRKIEEVKNDMLKTTEAIVLQQMNEFNDRYEILATEILNVKNLLLELQNYTMGVNKMLIEERINIFSEVPTNQFKTTNDEIKLGEEVVVLNERDDSVKNEEPVEEPLEEPVEEPVEETVEEPVEETVEEPVEEHVEAPVEEPVEETVEEPVEEHVEAPVEEPVEETVEEPVEEPVEETVEEPVEETVEEPVEETVEEPVEETVEEPMQILETEQLEKPLEESFTNDVYSETTQAILNTTNNTIEIKEISNDETSEFIVVTKGKKGKNAKNQKKKNSVNVEEEVSLSI
jgi:hypothetical protein